MENENATPIETSSEVLETAPVELNDIDIDAIFDEALGKPNTETNHKGLNTKQIIDSLPEEAKQLVNNLRGMTTKKTQALAEEKRQLELERQKLIDDRNLWLNETEERLLRAANSPDEDIDIYSQDGMNKLVEKQVAQKLLEQNKILKDQVSKQERAKNIQEFKRQHSDMDKYKDDIAMTLASNKNLSLIDAYWVVKGQHAEKTKLEEGARYKQQIEQKKNAIEKVSTGINMNGTPTKKFSSAEEAYEYRTRTGNWKR